jgi:hypothetical protein
MPASTPTAPFLHGFRVRGTAGDYTDTRPALREIERVELDSALHTQVELEWAGLAETPWDETEVVGLTRSFLADRGRFLHYVCS